MRESPEQPLLDAVSALNRALEDDDPFTDTARIGASLLTNAGELHAELALLLARFHWLRYQHLPEGDDQEALADALSLFASLPPDWAGRLPQQVAVFLGADSAADPESLASLGLLLLRRARETGYARAAQGAVRFLAGAEAIAGADRLNVLVNTVAALITLFEATGDPGALDRAVDVGQRLVTTAPRDSPDLASAYGNLAAPLLARYRERGDSNDLTAAVGAARTAVAIAEETRSGDLSTYLANLSGALRLLGGTTGGQEELRQAVSAARRSVELAGPEREEHAPLTISLASTLMAAHDAFGDPHLADEAIAALSEAITRLRPGHPIRAVALTNLGNIHRQAYLATGEQDRLYQALAAHAEAVEAGERHPQQPTFLTNLATDLNALHQLTGYNDELDEAIRISEQALSMTRQDDSDRPARASNLASFLWTSALRSGDLSRLDRAVDLLRSSAGDAPEADRAGVLNNLSAVLLSRFEAAGRTGDLNEAVEAAREATAVDLSSSERSLYLSTFANALLTRYETTADTTYLDQAVGLLDDAQRGLGPGRPDRPAYLSNLGNALRTRFERSEHPEDLTRGIQVLGEAVALTDPGQPEHATYRSNLASLHHSAFAANHDPEQLDEAITMDRSAADLLPADHPDRPRVLSNLSISLLARWNLSAAMTDLDDAISTAAEAVELAPVTHPNRAAYLGSLGNALATRFGISGRAADLTDALSRLEEATQSSARPMIRLLAARRWGDAAARAGRPAEGMRAFGVAFSLLGQVAPRRLQRIDQQHELRELSGLASEAAACALDADDPRTALQWLEQGRGVLLAQQLEQRTELDDLAESHPQLAARFEEVCRALDQEPDSPALRAQLASRWETLLVDIRAQDGFEAFLDPPTPEALLAEAADGPIVMISLGERRSDALVLTGRGLLPVSLPQLDPATAKDRVAEFIAAVAEAHNPASTWSAVSGAQARLGDVLAWEWDVIAAPVLDALAYRMPSNTPPRVWWSATGELAFLPLHAAGHHTEADGRSVLDRVVSSYTPVVGILRHLRRGLLTRSSDPPRTLVVSASEADGLPRLPGAAEEVADILRRTPAATVLEPQGTEVSWILESLKTHSRVHFACHGLSDATDPSSSRLVLGGAELSVRDITRLRLPDARLAYLSACDTARSNQAIPDEAIHIAAAFQLAGFADVVATLWPVVDDVARDVTEAVYGVLLAGSDAPVAQALHQVVCTTRARYRAFPSLWAAHVHAGI